MTSLLVPQPPSSGHGEYYTEGPRKRELVPAQNGVQGANAQAQAQASALKAAAVGGALAAAPAGALRPVMPTLNLKQSGAGAYVGDENQNVQQQGIRAVQSHRPAPVASVGSVTARKDDGATRAAEELKADGIKLQQGNAQQRMGVRPAPRITDRLTRAPHCLPTPQARADLFAMQLPARTKVLDQPQTARAASTSYAQPQLQPQSAREPTSRAESQASISLPPEATGEIHATPLTPAGALKLYLQVRLGLARAVLRGILGIPSCGIPSCGIPSIPTAGTGAAEPEPVRAGRDPRLPTGAAVQCGRVVGPLSGRPTVRSPADLAAHGMALSL